ncbi:MAG: MFS transporter [Candidatus Dormibacteria bacterium]
MSTTSTPQSISASRSRPLRRLVLGSVALGLFLAALDAYVVVTLLARMVADLGLPVDHLERATPVVTGFLLGYIVAMPLLGALSDARGRTPVYLASLGVFALGSVVTATAGLWGQGQAASIGPVSLDAMGLPWLVAGRVLQGLGGGALVPVALAMAADLYPPGARAGALGIIAALQETGSVLGPLYGAAVAELAAQSGGWRAVFWVNLPLTALCAAGFLVAAQRIKRAAPRQPSPPQVRVDWLGGLLLGAALGLAILALYPDNPERSAVGPLFIPLGMGSLAAAALFAWRQVTVPNPLLPGELLRNRVFAGANLANLLVGAGLMVALVDVPIIGRGVYSLGQLGSALLLARFMFAIPIGAVVGGLVSSRVGYRATAFPGLVLAALAFLEMSQWGPGELNLHFYGVREADVILGLCGLGFGLVIAPIASAILDRSASVSHGIASSTVVVARSTGMLLGLSALSAFGLHRFRQLFEQGPALHLVPGSADLAAQTAAIEARFRSALLVEYHEVFMVTAAICLLAAAIVLFTLPGRRRTAPLH